MAFSTNTIALVAFILAMAFSEPISELTCGHLFYRALYLDDTKDVLYVGAMDRLLKGIYKESILRYKLIQYLPLSEPGQRVQYEL